MKLFLVGGLLLAAAQTPSDAVAAIPDVPTLAAAYGARPSVADMQMSPSGDQVLYITPVGTQGSAVVVANAAKGTTTILLSSDKANVLPFGCGWKSETRVICRVYLIHDAGAQRLSFNRAISIAADGSSRVYLGQRADDAAVQIDQQGARVIDWVPDDPTHVLMQVYMAEKVTQNSNIASRGAGISVQLVDINTGRMTQVERPTAAARFYASDNQGHVRYMESGERSVTGYERDAITYLVRSKASKDWRRVGADALSGATSFGFLGFDDSGSSMFVSRNKDGHAALFRDPVDPDGAGGLVFANPHVDVDGVLRIGKFRRPVAAVYTTESTQYAFFDQALDRRSKALANALPGKPPVTILDESWDGQRDLIHAGGVTDPGQYYRFDLATRQLAPLLPVRPELAPYAAGTQTAVRYAASDGAQVPGFLTVPAGPAVPRRPAIIMPHGGPADRDALGFDWLAQYFTQLGYVVLQPNFRGSTGYGEEWYADNGFKSWAAAMGDINAGARWLVKEGIADPNRLAIVGWSYGGYAALQANIVDPTLYKAIVAIAPVTDLALLKRNAIDFANFDIVSHYVGEGPHIAAGSPAQNAGRITAPVLMFQGDKDQNVDISQARLMDGALARAGKRHELIIYPGLAHALDDSAARTDMLIRSARWLAEAMAPK